MLDLDPSRQGPTPRDASTLVVVRNAGGGGIEVFCVERQKVGFLGGAVVFPGGKLDPSDMDAGWVPCVTPPRVPRSPMTSDEAMLRGVAIAACRESLEEAAILPINRGGADARGATRVERAREPRARRAPHAAGVARRAARPRVASPAGALDHADGRIAPVRHPLFLFVADEALEGRARRSRDDRELLGLPRGRAAPLRGGSAIAGAADPPNARGSWPRLATRSTPSPSPIAHV